MRISNRHFLRGVAIASAALFASVAPAATQIVVGGELAGATGVDVSGTLYDVTFVDGTCASAFDGCDAQADFTFTTLLGATAAAQALLDQVFLDDLSGNFDSSPASIFGCNLDAACHAGIAYAVGDGRVYLAAAANNAGTGDMTYAANVPLAFDTSPSATRADSAVWAKFSPSEVTISSFQVSAAPEPATWAMMIGGLGMVGGAMRSARRRRERALAPTLA